MNLRALASRLLSLIAPSRPPRGALTLDDLPPLPPLHVERPSPLACTPQHRCKVCRGLGTLPWAEGER